MPEGICSQDVCQAPVRCRNLCQQHYDQWYYKNRDRIARPSIAERYWSKVIQDGDCWTWAAGKTLDGYGNFKIGGTHRRAHRVSYEWLISEIPEGLQLDHLCRNRACVNPWHLDPVTQKVNAERGAHATKTECNNGHPYSDDNTFRHKDGRRECRICRREDRRAAKIRQRAAAA